MNKTPQERQKAIMNEWLENGCGDKSLTQRAKATANALFATCRNDGLDEHSFRANLAMLSGGAAATLLDCAKALEDAKGATLHPQEPTHDL